MMVPGSLHHLIVAGCNKKPPRTKHNVWNCGTAGNPVLEPSFDSFVVTFTYIDFRPRVFFRLALRVTSSPTLCISGPEVVSLTCCLKMSEFP